MILVVRQLRKEEEMSGIKNWEDLTKKEKVTRGVVASAVLLGVVACGVSTAWDIMNGGKFSLNPFNNPSRASATEASDGEGTEGADQEIDEPFMFDTEEEKAVVETLKKWHQIAQDAAENAIPFVNECGGKTQEAKTSYLDDTVTARVADCKSEGEGRTSFSQIGVGADKYLTVTYAIDKNGNLIEEPVDAMAVIDGDETEIFDAEGALDPAFVKSMEKIQADFGIKF
jgi:hypothetical protein